MTADHLLPISGYDTIADTLLYARAVTRPRAPPVGHEAIEYLLPRRALHKASGELIQIVTDCAQAVLASSPPQLSDQYKPLLDEIGVFPEAYLRKIIAQDASVLEDFGGRLPLLDHPDNPGSPADSLLLQASYMSPDAAASINSSEDPVAMLDATQWTDDVLSNSYGPAWTAYVLIDSGAVTRPARLLDACLWSGGYREVEADAEDRKMILERVDTITASLHTPAQLDRLMDISEPLATFNLAIMAERLFRERFA